MTLNRLTQIYLRSFRPRLNGLVAMLMYRGTNISFGKNFRCDSIPRILIDKEAKLTIADNVYLGRNVEVRCHMTSQITIEKGVKIDRSVRILSTNNAQILISEGSKIGLNSVLNGGDSITIGVNSMLSGFVYLQTSMHKFNNKDFSMREQGYKHAPISLAEDTWLGAHTVIMPNVSLGKGSIAGSNSVVTKSFKEFSIIAGVPGELLKTR